MGGLVSHGILVLSTLVISVVLLNQSLVLVSGLDPRKITVHLENHLFPTNQELTVHCQSGDDDLGVHQLPYLDYYEFSFKNNAADTTLFFCHFEWLNTTTSTYQNVAATYDIYKSARDQGRCDTLCNWRIQEEGLFSYNDKNQYWDGLYTWPGHSI